MQWNDQAIIVSQQKYSDNAIIVTMFTKERGIHKGLVKGATGKRQRGIYQLGNMVDVTWRGRLSEQLGQFSAELITPVAALVLSDTKRLCVLHAFCTLIEHTLAEREPHMDYFQHVEGFLTLLMANHDTWMGTYVALELQLLGELGFGLDLERCAATGLTENLAYVSPKSGCAVSQDAGEPYKDKLFTLPEFLITREFSHISEDNMHKGLAICSYFFNKYVFQPHGKLMPPVRLELETMI